MAIFSFIAGDRMIGRARVISLACAALLFLFQPEPAAQTNLVTGTNAVSALPTNAVSARYSLAEAQRIAFERNWDLLAAQSDVDLAVAQKIVAKEFPNPTLAISSLKI